MSLAKLIFGDQRAYATPPFAPAPVGATTAPAQHGLAGFIDRVFNPTNALGQFSQALFAAGGNPGDAMAYMMQAHNKGQHIMQVGDTIGVVDDRTGQFVPTYTAPKQPTGFAAELAADGIDPNSPEGLAMQRRRIDNSLDPFVTFNNEQGSYYGPRSGLPGALGNATLAPPTGLPQIGSVVADPRKGGGAGNGTGGFRGL